ncbi:MAG: hypothetical protein AAGA81_13885 [Acidobacteriota bacterium]
MKSSSPGEQLRDERRGFTHFSKQDALDLGQPLLVVQGVGTQFERDRGLPVLQHVGTAGHEVLGEPLGLLAPLLEGQLSPLVLGKDDSVDGVDELSAGRLVVVEANGVGIDDLDVADRLLGEGVAVSRVLRDLGLPGVAHVLGGERRAVAPDHVIAQLEGQLQSIVGKLPRGREPRRERQRTGLEVRLLVDQRQEELIEDRAVERAAE